MRNDNDDVTLGTFGVVLLVGAIALLFGGCALDRADPAARSARATYGAISVVVSGDGSTCNLTIGDGALAAADGDGTVSQPTTQVTTQSPQITAPGDWISAGIGGLVNLIGKGIDAMGRGSSAAKAPAAGADGCTGADCAVK